MSKKIVILLMILMVVYSIKAASSRKIECSELFQDPVNLASEMSDEDLEKCAEIFLDNILASIERENDIQSSSSWEKLDVKRSKPRRKSAKNKIFGF